MRTPGDDYRIVGGETVVASPDGNVPEPGGSGFHRPDPEQMYGVHGYPDVSALKNGNPTSVQRIRRNVA